MPIGIGIAPLDGTERGVAEEVVEDADGSQRLVLVGDVRVVRIPMRRDVLDRDGVAAVHAKGE